MAQISDEIESGLEQGSDEIVATREERIAQIAAFLEANPDDRDKLLAEIFVNTAEHKEILEQIAQTMAELLADPKRIIGAMFGRKRGRRRRGEEDPEPEAGLDRDTFDALRLDHVHAHGSGYLPMLEAEEDPNGKGAS